MIYQLKYNSKTEAIQDLKNKSVLNEDGTFNFPPTHNVVYVEKIPDQSATYDQEGNEITPTIYKDGFHVDVMDDRNNLDFGANRTFPNTPYHTF